MVTAIAELGRYDDVAREAPAGATSTSPFATVRPAAGSRSSARPWTAAAARPSARDVGELARLRRRGDRAVLLFCVARAGVSHVRPADEIDPVYGAALRRAAAAGVEVYAYRAAIDRAGIALADAIPVELRSPC